ncbi:sulfate reduction electron transfer complex DsrMKJOP subunit DsrP [Gimesia aquarii]|uniref:Putative hydrogenase 2 b cytochrome subunit n=1 Tax=Gimesia aquarii TaxID=2527964 RepID=A0A517W170_9PLAN|nr:NrfD/PsrC family molybdoenzyme membrane anchor subunit [Gimesia aquarii]QDT99001.1 putative hydrogenase 2 b cytochrome subunit [Gimesia aquarii]
MVEAQIPSPPAPQKNSAVLSYLGFLRRATGVATDGEWYFYVWMIVLSGIALVGANAWAQQVRDGMIVTNMSDHVSWGLYIANFTFCVGLAAGGVMMVIPAYLYDDEEMHQVVIIGEAVAIAAILMSTLSVVVDLGRPDRFWHLIPGIGKFNWPLSMLTWDIIVLNGYLLINLHIVGYLLYMRYLGRKPNPKWYIPFVFLSIFWAISIHTITAFLYCGLGGRPFWNTALLAPRFLASAFVSGPAFIILSMRVMRLLTDFHFSPKPANTLIRIIRVSMCVNLLMLFSEVFTLFYTGGSHASSAQYLFFGSHGANGLVPWMWASIVLNIVGAILFFTPAALRRENTRIVACLFCIVGIWIEKGMGLIIPGFIPSTLHEVVEYSPSLIEWKVTAGIWAFGLLILTLILKLIASVFSYDLSRKISMKQNVVPEETPATTSMPVETT